MARAKRESRSQYPWYHRYIKSQIDRVWGWCPERKKALERARIGILKWKCEECGAEPLGPKERDVDHTAPRVNVLGWDGYDLYVARSFVPAENLVVKCKPCHKRKSESENKVRRASKRKAKADE